MELKQTRTFQNKVKKLHKNQKEQLDQALKQIVKNPLLGELKKGDLEGVRVYKFKMVNQLTLVAYLFNAQEQSVTLLAIGTHENFYNNLKS